MQKTADTRFPIHDLIAQRWSPRAFAPTPVTAEQVGSLVEAARWAPSCFNEQPWSFFVATQDGEPEAWERIASCLMDGNSWAREAPLLILSVAKRTFDRNGKDNPTFQHDVGLAVGNLILQAQALGLVSHQMAGFDGARAREVLSIPDGHDPVAVIAVGHEGDASALPEGLAERESAPRSRRELSEFVFGGTWGEARAL